MSKFFARTEQEEKIEDLFHELTQLFKQLDLEKDNAKIQRLLKDVTSRLKDAKNIIKDFEREARTDGMPVAELAERKRELVNELNSYIAMKKDYGNTLEARKNLLQGGEVTPETGPESMTMQELMVKGRKDMKETDKVLARAERVVEDTLQIGTQTAATLQDQSVQLNKIVDELDEIHFTMKKASLVIRDLGRGLMTDKCIGFLLLLTVLGVIALVVVKIIKPNKNKIPSSQQIKNGTMNAIDAAKDYATGNGNRRLLMTLTDLALMDMW